MAKQDNMNSGKRAGGVGHIFAVIGKIVGTILLTAFLTALIFACLFAVYVKNDLSEQAQWASDSFSMEQTSVIYYEDPDTGKYEVLQAIYGGSNSTFVEYDDIPKNLINACIAIEDKRFEKHNGVDFLTTSKAGLSAILQKIGLTGFYGGATPGASTITQQVVRNITNDRAVDGAAGWARKLREIFRALNVEKYYTKPQIIETYLNLASFSQNCSGIQAAANVFFNKDVSELTLWECASIASITKNPTNYNPYTNPENLIHRRNFIMYNMWQQGIISEEDYRNGAAQPLVLAEEDTNKKTSSVTSYFTDALFTEVVRDIMDKEGVDESTAQSMLYTGGYTIEATVNPKMQTAMENLMRNEGDAYFPAGWHEEEVTSISDDDVQVMNADGTPKTRTGDDGTPLLRGFATVFIA